MKLRNTVYGITCNDCKMCHLHLAIINDCHLTDLLRIIRILLLDLFHKSAVDLFNNLINSGKKSGEQLDWPFFQSLCHDGMVGVCTGLRGDCPCFIPGKIIFIHENSH